MCGPRYGAVNVKHCAGAGAMLHGNLHHVPLNKVYAATLLEIMVHKS